MNFGTGCRGAGTARLARAPGKNIPCMLRPFVPLSLRNVTCFCLWERTAESATATRPVGSCLVKAPHIPRPAHHCLNQSKQSLPDPAWMHRSITGPYLSYPPQWTNAILLSSPIICFRFICALDCLGHLPGCFERVNPLGGPLTAQMDGDRTNSPPPSIHPSTLRAAPTAESSRCCTG